MENRDNVTSKYFFQNCKHNFIVDLGKTSKRIKENLNAKNDFSRGYLLGLLRH